MTTTKTKIKRGTLLLSIIILGIIYHPLQATSNGPPTLDYAPQEYDFGEHNKGGIEYTKLYIWSGGTCGDDMLIYTLQWNCPWVIASPKNGSCTCGEIDTIQIKIDTTTLTQGEHTCTIQINSNGGSGYYTIRVYIRNNPPLTLTITGKQIGQSKKNYTYQGITTDPEDDPVYYTFSWGNGIETGWLGPYPSGDPAIITHQWPNGIHTIQVKAQDDKGAESAWSDPLPIIMPTFMNRPINHFIEKLISWKNNFQ